MEYKSILNHCALTIVCSSFLWLILLISILSNTSYAAINSDKPNMIPEHYEIFTDARFFVTRVSVNGNALKLSNDEGNGSTLLGGKCAEKKY